MILGFAGRSVKCICVLPVWFQDTYYAVFGQCCCYCQSGSPVKAYTASAPLGPYTPQGFIDDRSRAANQSTHACPHGRVAWLAAATSDSTRQCLRRAPFESGIAAQQTDIFAFQGADGVAQFIWVGDRWQQAPDGIKGHDPTYWGLLHFFSNGSIVPMKFTDEFSVDVL